MFDLDELKQALGMGRVYSFETDGIHFSVKCGPTSPNSDIDVEYVNGSKDDVLVTLSNPQSEDYEALASASAFMGLLFGLDAANGFV